MGLNRPFGSVNAARQEGGSLRPLRIGNLALLLVSSAVALNSALAVQAQDPQQPRYTERVDVARVLVDVRVVDDIGNPVLGLGADNFKVKINEKPVRVESARWVGGGEPQAGEEPLAEAGLPGAASPGSLGRLIVLLLQKDLEPSRIVGLTRMLIEAQGFLDSLTSNDRVAVLSFDSHLKIWLDFTTTASACAMSSNTVSSLSIRRPIRRLQRSRSLRGSIQRKADARSALRKVFSSSLRRCNACPVRSRSCSSATAWGGSARWEWPWSMTTSRHGTHCLRRGPPFFLQSAGSLVLSDPRLEVDV